MSRRKITKPSSQADTGLVSDAEHLAKAFRPRGGDTSGLPKKQRTALYATSIVAYGGAGLAEAQGLLPVVMPLLSTVCPMHGTDERAVFARPAVAYYVNTDERLAANPAAQHRAWKLLSRVGRAVDPGSWAEPDNPYSDGSQIRPCSVEELNFFKRAGRSLEPDRRSRYEAAFTVCIGFGVTGDAMSLAHHSDFRFLKGGTVTFTPSTGRHRTIPCASDWVDGLRELLDDRRGQYVLATSNGRVPTSTDVRAALAPRLLTDAGVKTPTAARLASTWRYHRFLSGLSPLAISSLSGHKTLTWMNEFAHLMDGLTLDDFDLAQQAPDPEQLALRFHRTTR